jgi:hypothetical protein
MGLLSPIIPRIERAYNEKRSPLDILEKLEYPLTVVEKEACGD